MRRLIWGRHAVMEALRMRPGLIRVVYVVPGTTGDIMEEITKTARAHGIRVFQEDRKRMGKMVRDEAHQGVAAELSGPVHESAKLLDVLARVRAEGQMPFFLLLDQVQDPHNFGAILRTAVGAGVHAVVMVNDRSVGVTPAVIKASAGAALHLPICQVPNLVSAMEQLKAEGVWCVGADAEGEQSYAAFDWKRPVALVMGQEGEGLRRLVRDHCEATVRIPLEGTVGSLNVSVAAGVLLFEVRKTRVAGTAKPARRQK